MKSKTHIVARELGKIRLFVGPRERVPQAGFFRRLAAKPLYRELIAAAKKDGLHSAMAFATYHGFSGGDEIRSVDPEIGHTHTTLCVEFVDQKEKLEAFCHLHHALLKGKSIIYKHVEHWTVQDGELSLEAGPSQ